MWGKLQTTIIQCDQSQCKIIKDFKLFNLIYFTTPVIALNFYNFLAQILISDINLTKYPGKAF